MSVCVGVSYVSDHCDILRLAFGSAAVSNKCGSEADFDSSAMLNMPNVTVSNVGGVRPLIVVLQARLGGC